MKDLNEFKAKVKQTQGQAKTGRASDKKIKATHTNQHSKRVPNHNRGNR